MTVPVEKEKEAASNSSAAPAARRLFAAAGVLAALAAALVVFVVDPARSSWFLPKCMFHALTGLYCPGCGISRASHSLVHGDFAAALGYNPLAVIIGIPAAGYIFLNWLSIAARGRTLPTPRIGVRLSFAIIALIVLFWILRNIPVYPFTILAP